MDIKTASYNERLNYSKNALDWWHNYISINEQKTAANKYLATWETSMLLGSYSQYTSSSKQNELKHKIWISELLQINAPTPEQINDMRVWLSECSFVECYTLEDYSNMSDNAIVKAVNQHFDGGVTGFLNSY